RVAAVLNKEDVDVRTRRDARRCWTSPPLRGEGWRARVEAWNARRRSVWLENPGRRSTQIPGKRNRPWGRQQRRRGGSPKRRRPIRRSLEPREGCGRCFECRGISERWRRTVRLKRVFRRSKNCGDNREGRRLRGRAESVRNRGRAN